jgi:purine nucleoside phosphorylase
VTDYDAGVDGHEPVTMETVLEVLRQNVAAVRTLLETALPRIT